MLSGNARNTASRATQHINFKASIQTCFRRCQYTVLWIIIIILLPHLIIQNQWTWLVFGLSYWTKDVLQSILSVCALEAFGFAITRFVFKLVKKNPREATMSKTTMIFFPKKLKPALFWCVTLSTLWMPEYPVKTCDHYTITVYFSNCNCNCRSKTQAYEFSSKWKWYFSILIIFV